MAFSIFINAPISTFLVTEKSGIWHTRDISRVVKWLVQQYKFTLKYF